MMMPAVVTKMALGHLPLVLVMVSCARRHTHTRADTHNRREARGRRCDALMRQAHGGEASTHVGGRGHEVAGDDAQQRRVDDEQGRDGAADRAQRAGGDQQGQDGGQALQGHLQSTRAVEVAARVGERVCHVGTRCGRAPKRGPVEPGAERRTVHQAKE